MSAIRLVVFADGLGMCHAANQAICEAFEVGTLTTAAAMAAGPWIAEAADLVRDHPHWDAGLRLTLTCPTLGCRWGPVAGPRSVPTLATETGTFFPALPEKVQAAHVRRELAAQLDRACAWGLEPAFVECDEEDHPAVAGPLRNLRRRLGLPDRMSTSGLRLLELPTGAGETRTVEVLPSLAPGTYVWTTRPSQDAPEAWGLWPYAVARQQDADYQALCSPAVRAAIQQAGIELISYRDFLKT